MSNSSICSILDMPDEILVKIILHLDAADRMVLGNSCQRFDGLVFDDAELLRNLDFSRKSLFPEESDILQYFSDENACKKILRINFEHVHETVTNLSRLICKAINLVELNVLDGLEFHYLEELSYFLKPLVHLKRLSVNLPTSCMLEDSDYPYWSQLLKEPFSRLTYLSLHINCYTDSLLLILQYCQQLEELRMLTSDHLIDDEIPLPVEPMKISSLKVVRAIDGVGFPGPLKNDLMSIVSDPAEWTVFYLVELYNRAYLEKNVEVCAELEQLKKMPLPQYVMDLHVPGLMDEGWSLIPEYLLNEVIRTTHEDPPKNFCCLSRSPQVFNKYPCLLRIEEAKVKLRVAVVIFLNFAFQNCRMAKKLLKDSGYQISYLDCAHTIDKNCDVHLLASAFPNLTTLVLHRITTLVSEKSEPLQRRLRRKGSVASDEHSDAMTTDSSFKMLVENTPRLEVLVISPDYSYHSRGDVESWDLDALYLITGWKNLTVIRLCRIPITDGKFLIDIARECKKLEEVMLHNLYSPEKINSYESELLQMLQLCKNLRKLSIHCKNLKHLSMMFDILSNYSRLKVFDLETTMEESGFLELISSVEKMLCQCQELRMFFIDMSPYKIGNKFRLETERIIKELNRPNFQFSRDTQRLQNGNAYNVFFTSPLMPFPRYG